MENVNLTINEESEIEEIIKDTYKEWIDSAGCIPQGTTYYSELMACAEDCAKKIAEAGYKKKSDLRIHEMQMKNGEIDMTIGSDDCTLFIWSIIQIFKQNCGKNFVTTTVEVDDKQGERYALTIQKIGGESPAEHLNRIRRETAKEIFQDLYKQANNVWQAIEWTTDDLKQFAKKYDIEIDED